MFISSKKADNSRRGISESILEGRFQRVDFEGSIFLVRLEVEKARSPSTRFSCVLSSRIGLLEACKFLAIFLENLRIFRSLDLQIFGSSDKRASTKFSLSPNETV